MIGLFVFMGIVGAFLWFYLGWTLADIVADYTGKDGLGALTLITVTVAIPLSILAQFFV